MNDARVLIVEDNSEVAEMLVLFLSSRGYKVTVAPDGAAAQELVRESLPNLILLDVGLPDMDGYEVLNKFRESNRTRHIPIIFLTQRSKKIDRLTGLQLGADDFISKPFDLEELFLRVQNAVNRAARENLSDPHTGLPTGQAVREALADARKQRGRTTLEFRLKHMGEFRDLYGSLAGAHLLRYTALTLNRVVNSIGDPQDFLGQMDEETFVVVTGPERVDTIRRTAIERFSNDAVQHYALGERSGDKVKVKDAAGQDRVVPIVQLDAAPLS
jgi:DNA-binding response OmpR family regulator